MKQTASLQLHQSQRVFASWLRLIVLAFAVLLHAAGAQAAGDKRYDVSIYGVDGERRDNIVLHLGDLEQRVLDNPRRLNARATKATRAALEPFGHYQAQVDTTYSDGKVELQVDPGPRLAWGEPQIELPPEALAVKQLAALVAGHPFREKAMVSHKTYDDYRENLFRSVWQLGFFDAQYSRRNLLIDLNAGTATPVLELNAGRRYTFGDRHYSGTNIDEDLLESLANFNSDDAFDNELVLAFDRRLRDTNYFRSSVVQLNKREDGHVDVEVMLDDNNKSRYEIGAGFSTNADLRLRLNRHTPLVNEHGHSFTIESDWSAQRQTLESIYRIPVSNPLDDRYELNLGIQNKDIEDTEVTKASAGAFHAVRFREYWNLAWGASYDHERYTIGNDPEEEVTYLLPAVTLSRKNLQSGIDPMSGSYYWSSIDFSAGTLGSKTEFLRLRGGVKWLFGLGDNNTTVLTRAEGGTIITDSVNNIPASLRFYAGGDNSVRGYDLESLAPRDSDGDIIGGRYLAVGSVEISRRVLPTWRVATFFDSGAAFSNTDDRFYQSAGLGVRWLSPIGQIRLDLAFPVFDGGSGDFKLHISMGPPL